MNDIVIVSGVRTAVGSFGGSLKDISAQDLGALVIKEAVTRAGISPEAVDEVIIGQVGQIAEDGFVGRAVILKRAGLSPGDNGLFCEQTVWLRASGHS